jgi:hypothetical protein
MSPLRSRKAVGRREELFLSKILMRPPFWTMNKRESSPGGAVINTGNVRFVVTGCSVRLVDVGD